jgi:hypothetical protein
MAIKRKLQVRYGAAASRPILSTGELGLDTDTGSEALYVGTPAGNKQVANLGYVLPKKYVALLTQSATSAPVATVLQNSLSGTPVWSYVSTGTYNLTLTGEFTVGKTIIRSMNLDLVRGDEYGDVVASRSLNTIALVTYDISNTPADDLLSSTLMEIEVYP